MDHGSEVVLRAVNRGDAALNPTEQQNRRSHAGISERGAFANADDCQTLDA